MPLFILNKGGGEPPPYPWNISVPETKEVPLEYGNFPCLHISQRYLLIGSSFFSQLPHKQNDFHQFMGTFTISHVSLELLKKIYGVNLEEHTIAWRRLQSRVTKNRKRTNLVWIIMVHSMNMQAKEIKTKEIRP